MDIVIKTWGFFYTFYLPHEIMVWGSNFEGYSHESWSKKFSDVVVINFWKNHLFRVTPLWVITLQTWSKFEGYVWWGLQMFDVITGVRDMWRWSWVVELVVERFKFHMMSLLEDYGHNKCEFEGYLSKD